MSCLSEEEPTADARQKLHSIQGTILSFNKRDTDDSLVLDIICLDQADKSQFSYTYPIPFGDDEHSSLFWEGVRLIFVNTSVDVQNKIQFINHSDTIMVLEPDYLMDASAIAECFMDRSSNPNLFFLQRSMPNLSNAALLSGIFINQLLDAYLGQDEPVLQDVFKETLINNIFTALRLGSNELNRIRKYVIDTHLPVIEKVTAEWKYKTKMLEPSFISSDYGLQGRLDVLLEYMSETGIIRDIIELKSSKPRDTDVWVNNRMQVVCYHLLLRSVYGMEREGSNFILYSRSADNPLRPVPTVNLWEKEVLKIRNSIVSTIHGIAFGNQSLLDFNVGTIGEFPPFMKEDIVAFQRFSRELSDLERHYINKFISFLFRELWSSKLGTIVGCTNTGYGFNALWKLDKQEKKDQFTLMDGLVYSSQEGNLIRFLISDDSDIANFRTGDMVILYPDLPGKDSMLKDQVRKGFIEGMDTGSMDIQIKNSDGMDVLLAKHPNWVIEHDYNESGTFHMIRSLFQFMRSEKSKRELILGKRQPFIFESDWKLQGTTDRVIHKALISRDYFLLQGPPGTGKTSKFLTSLVQNLLSATEDTIVILAFTNRAVDEICLRLNQHAIDYMRLGHGDQQEFHYLNHAIREMSYNDIYLLIGSNRILVSTVSTYIGQYQEISAIKKLDTLIVDEASQLLEPHLAGILTVFRRFVLIGDQNQLPAVVTQRDELRLDEDPAMKELGFHAAGQSLFERLFRRCESQGWTQAYDMLENHYRMHEEIQALVNPYYSNRLTAGTSRQTSILKSEKHTDHIKWRDVLSKRTVMIAVVGEKNFKRSKQEAVIVSELLAVIREQFGSAFTCDTVGVITTWRAQINEIKSRITDPDILEKVTIDTVERYQGSERDIIIYSTALSNPGQLSLIESVSHDLKVDRKLNVAISRAREQFILLGNPEVLQHSAHYTRVLEQMKANGCYIDLRES